jgi:hypothetical protein
MKKSLYHSDWQNNRINFMLEKYGPEFFKGKKILELGAFNGYIGAFFGEIGAKVHCIDGREENVENIKRDYPNLTAECHNLDSPEWTFGKWDIIINFGLFYHLENFHKEHLKNCLANCDLLFFETVVFDDKDPLIYLRYEEGNDQSLSARGGTPTTSFIEETFLSEGYNFKKFTDRKLNDGYHHYDWEDLDSKKYDAFARRFWIVN